MPPTSADGRRLHGSSHGLPQQPQHPTPQVAALKDTPAREEERVKDRKQTPLSASVCQELCLIVDTR